MRPGIPVTQHNLQNTHPVNHGHGNLIALRPALLQRRRRRLQSCFRRHYLDAEQRMLVSAHRTQYQHHTQGAHNQPFHRYLLLSGSGVKQHTPCQRAT
jgi:hypothetical protein